MLNNWLLSDRMVISILRGKLYKYNYILRSRVTCLCPADLAQHFFQVRSSFNRLYSDWLTIPTFKDSGSMASGSIGPRQIPTFWLHVMLSLNGLNIGGVRYDN